MTICVCQCVCVDAYLRARAFFFSSCDLVWFMQGEASYFAPYLDLLPSAYPGLPLCWDPSGLACLAAAAPNAFARAINGRRMAAKQVGLVVPLFLKGGLLLLEGGRVGGLAV